MIQAELDAMCDRIHEQVMDEMRREQATVQTEQCRENLEEQFASEETPCATRRARPDR